jgi:flagellin-like protein
MKFARKRAVSPIIASLLLIAIAVAAGIIVYVYVNSLAGGLTGTSGQQVSGQVEMTAYNFQEISADAPPTNAGCVTSGTGNSSPCAIIYVKNTGGSAVTLGNVYFDGVALTEEGSAPTMNPQSDYEFALMQVYGTGSPTCAPGTGQCFQGLASSYTAGTSHTIKIVESTGTVTVLTIVAGKTG